MSDRFLHRVRRGQAGGGGGALLGGVCGVIGRGGGGGGQGRQARLRGAGGVGQAVSEPAVLVFQGRGGLGHPGLLQQGAGLRAALLALQAGVLMVLPLLGRGAALVLSRKRRVENVDISYHRLQLRKLNTKATYDWNLHNFTGVTVAP